MSSTLSKAASIVRAVVYIIVIAGAALYLYGLYESRGEWRVELAAPPKVDFVSPTEVTIEAPLRIYNPSGSEVSAKLVYYQVYLNNVKVGDGLIPYLTIPPGWSNRTLKVTVDLLDLGCGGVEAISSGEARVSVSGYAMVDIKTIGGITWKTVTVSFNTTAKKVRIPEVSGEAKPLLASIEAICKVSQGGMPGVGLPFQYGGASGGSQGNGAGQSPEGEGQLEVNLHFSPQGVGRYFIVVRVDNYLDTSVRVSRIIVHTPLKDYNMTVDDVIEPRGVGIYDTAVIVATGTPVSVDVYTSVGVFKASGRAG